MNTQKTFEELKKDFEFAVIGGSRAEQGESLQALADALAFAILKKRIIKTADPYIINLNIDLFKDIKRRERIEYITENHIFSYIDDNGDYNIEYDEPEAEEGLRKLLAEPADGASDLSQECALSLWQEAVSAAQRGALQPGWLDAPYKTRVPSKKIYTKEIDIDNFKDFKVVELSPIRRAFRAGGRFIDKARSLRAHLDQYSYIEYKISIDGIDNIIYKRLGRAAELHEEAVAAAAERVAEIINNLKLTDKQEKILNYLYNGLGYKKVAEMLGCTPGAVYAARKSIQNKYINYLKNGGEIGRDELKNLL